MACLIEGWKWKTRDSNEIEHSIEKSSNTNQNSNDCYCDDHNHYGGLLGPVLEIDFGPPTPESKNHEDCINFDHGDLSLGSHSQLFGPPKCLWSSCHGSHGSRFQGLGIWGPQYATCIVCSTSVDYWAITDCNAP